MPANIAREGGTIRNYTAYATPLYSYNAPPIKNLFIKRLLVFSSYTFETSIMFDSRNISL